MLITEYILQLVGGIIIGLCISAPMGPAGILCLRRALEQGRRAGIITGVGATLGDLVYAIMTYLFTGILLDYIDRNMVPLRIVASLLFFGFATYLYFSTPRLEVSQRVAAKINQRNLSHLGSGFLLTIPNLLIVPVYVVLFSQFNFVYPFGEPPYGMFALGLISIALGALIWWLFITYIATRLRDLVSQRNLRIFNRIFALVFAVIAVVSLFYTFVAL
ncbi:LysE family translocator [uncultured Porphyromonas sp.]|uniref:LysE family translocator n=1 Tax=uncultured Porphyromonas sp. TaxID=159274 RepID=UPI0026257E40|nr:LysE family transporter [uncultured Porphyromonas sp.]